MITPTSQAEMETLARYFSEWKRAGVTRFWTGLSNSFEAHSGSCNMKLEDGSYANIPEVFWASGQPEVGCDQATPIDDNGNVEDSCTYIDILGGVEHSWNAGSCFGHDSYGCEVNVGDHIHDISNDNRVKFHCEKENGVYWYTYTDDIYANHFPQPLCYLQSGKTNTPDGHGSFYDLSLIHI